MPDAWFATDPLTGRLCPSPTSGAYPDPSDDTACTPEDWQAKIDRLLTEC